ncbi:MAG: ATPase [Synergistaceae bacterium]|jgi:V/A-type H+-transporting ATPase subunit K|nr:ATPase [Synergistaceae bacterium]
MFGLAISCGTVAAMIGLGYFMQRRSYKGGRAFYLSSLGISSLLVFTGAVLSLTMHPALAQTAAAPLGTGAGMGFIAASVSTGLACLGAGLAVASVGSAALGLVGEKPEMLGTTLIYLGLSEGIAIYGVIVSLLILGRV